MPEKTLKFLVPGGEATAGPPIGPALGPLGVNVLQVVEEINKLTREFKGMRVPVEVVVDTETKQFK
ncbi:MAG: 50S ribosomal protein L11, partial [Nitrososphaerota archaeon]